MTASMVGFCRITIATDETRADLSLPAIVPVAAVMPSMLRYVGKDLGRDADAGAGHGGWGLRDLDGKAIDLSQSMSANGVRDGDVLVLTPLLSTLSEPLFDDIVEIVGRDAVGDRWGVPDRRRAAAAAAIVGVLSALALLATQPRHGLVEGVVIVVAGVLLLLGGGALARAMGDAAAGAIAGGLAVPTVAIGAALVVDQPWGANRALIALAAALVIAAAIPGVVGAGEAVAAGFGIAVVLAAIGGVLVVTLDAAAAQGAAVSGALGVVVTALLPVASLRLAGLPRPRIASNAGDLMDIEADIDVDRTRRRVETARALLVAGVTGALAVTGVSCALLINDRSAWSIGLAAALLVAVVLRSRLFTSRSAVTATVGMALAGLVATATIAAITYAGDTIGIQVIVPAAAVIALIGLVVGVSAGRSTGSPRRGRLLDLLEVIVLIAIPPLVLGVWHVYTSLFHLG